MGYGFEIDSGYGFCCEPEVAGPRSEATEEENG